MALNKQDLLELKKAKENGLDLDQIIKSVENKVFLNELKEKLKIGINEIYYKSLDFVEKNIEEIAKIESAEKQDLFIMQNARSQYLKELEEREKETKTRQEENKKLESENKKQD